MIGFSIGGPHGSLGIMDRLNTHQKALTINLDRKIYGTFAEIGAGQEIARWFFKVGGAAGTVAKSMSAYDMIFSDEIYGKAGRYVSKQRLLAMLDHEFDLLMQRLGQSRGADTTFFAFADTVSARNYLGTNECHGWIGIRFQSRPGSAPSNIVMHVNMLDRENLQQQEALGILGVNLVYAAFRGGMNPNLIVRSLLDDLSIERIEIDMIELSGDAFSDIDNRRVGLQLLQLGLAEAIVFDPTQGLMQLSELAYKRPLLIERGAFRALNQLGLDFALDALSQFSSDALESGKEPLSMIEISINELQETQSLGDDETIHKIEELWKRDYRVMVTRFREFYQLTNYLRRYTVEPLAFLMGVSTLVRLFHAEYYERLPGKVLEGLSRLFTEGVGIYVYPMRLGDFMERLSLFEIDPPLERNFQKSWVHVADIRLDPALSHLKEYLLEGGFIKPINSSRVLEAAPVQAREPSTAEPMEK